MEEQRTVSVPIVSVSFHQFSHKAEIKVPEGGSMTGGILKEKVGVAIDTPKNRQIVVVLNPKHTLVEKIIHEETPLSVSELANVCILKCSLEAFAINVEVRWPGHEITEAKRETVHLTVSPDDQVSCIKERIELRSNCEIAECVVFISGQEVDPKDNKSLSFYHVTSSSQVKLIVVRFYTNSVQTSGAPSYAESDIAISDTSCKDLSDSKETAEIEPKVLFSASTPECGFQGRRHSVQHQLSETGKKKKFRKKSASLTQLDGKRQLLPPITQSPTTSTPASFTAVRLPPIGRQEDHMCKDRGQQSEISHKRKTTSRQKHQSEGDKDLVQTTIGYDDVTHTRQTSGNPPPQPECMSPVRTPKLKELLDALTPVCAKWLFIGIAMDIDTGALKAIEAQSSNNQIMCLQEMLTRRLAMNKPKLTWPTVVESLRYRFVKEQELAQEIEDKFVVD